jgi:hypothetical protein
MEGWSAQRLWIAVVVLATGVCALPSAADAADPTQLKLPREALDLARHGDWFASVENMAAAATIPRRVRSPLSANDALPRLGNDGPSIRIAGPLESFARRVHREGLPLARLFENRSMLISLGLNQKGKFGLWLIQKVP